MDIPATIRSQAPPEASTSLPRVVAVIDVGTASIRMAIAQISDDGRIDTLEALNQTVTLGEDTFGRGAIQRSTIEECVRVLRSYRQILDEYQVKEPDQIRAIATSAVREAGNTEAFLDRVYIATGIRIEAIDEAEVNRLTYLGIRPVLAGEPSLAGKKTAVVEVGGGVTKLLLVEDSNVLFSRAFRLGSLRLREVLETHRTPSGSMVSVMENQIDRTVMQIQQSMPVASCDALVGLGGDIRFAASHLLPDWGGQELARLPVSSLSHFTGKLLAMNVDEIVRKYHLSYPNAATVGPALMAYARLAHALGLKHILPSRVSLRDGLLTEMAVRGAWTGEFKAQIVRSALALGQKYQFNEQHARHVADLAGRLFHGLQDEHQLGERYELILHIAALLHEIGVFVSNRSHHKHSMYLIQNSDLFGLGRKDLLLVALVARYHRRAVPRPTHEGYALLDNEERIIVAKLAAILRIADALERSHSQRIENIECHRRDDQLMITVPDVSDLSLEQLAVKQKGPMFQDVYGLRVMLRKGSRTAE